MECLFCKIIAGQIPSYTIYEDELFVVILDRFPSSPGHSLVIPKQHTPDVFGLTAEESAAIIPVAQKVSKHLCDILDADGLNILQNNGKAAGQAVFHYHMHLIPRFDNDKVRMGFAPTDPSLEDLAAMKTRIGSF